MRSLGMRLNIGVFENLIVQLSYLKGTKQNDAIDDPKLSSLRILDNRSRDADHELVKFRFRGPFRCTMVLAIFHQTKKNKLRSE